MDASIARFVTDRKIARIRKSGPSSDRYKEAKGGETQRVGDARRLPPIRRNGEKGQVESQEEGCFIQMASFVNVDNCTLSAKLPLLPLWIVSESIQHLHNSHVSFSIVTIEASRCDV